MEQKEEDFFAITLQPEGSRYLLKLYKLMRWVFGGCVLLSICFLCTNIVRLIQSFRIEGEALQAIPTIVDIIISAVAIAQIYFYFRFTRLCKKGIENRDADLFNSSFKWLYRNTALTSVQVSLQPGSLIYYFFAGFS